MAMLRKLLAPLLAAWLLVVAPGEAGILEVIVLYDNNGDGQEEGVGAGIPVVVETPTGEFSNATDFNSSASFGLPHGTYTVRAYVDDFHPWFDWVCVEEVTTTTDHDFLVLNCQWRFFLRLPGINNE